ncbi:amino acid/polyamine transporter I [Aspergillus pseudoustus]|uniref:Amino acid/polyamine transporter I n=1 Tax=Aspergillus pseudoustus TaxID=1810923 RepID=A0ABR4JD18_9EURO
MSNAVTQKPLSSKADGEKVQDQADRALEELGYTSELRRNRSLFTLLFQSLAIAAVPLGESTAFMQTIYGGGQLSIFVGWIVVCVLDQCVAMSLAELASRYPTSAGPYYWSFQLAGKHAKLLSFITAWIWLIGNWTVTLSVNFAIAGLLVATVSLFSSWEASDWQLLLVFYAICLVTFLICGFANHLLPIVDTICAAWTIVTTVVVLVAVSVSAKAGRHNAATTLGQYDTSISGWGDFSFFIGLLPPAFVFCAVGMVTSMAEEVHSPEIKVPQAMALSIPVGGISGVVFIIPICATLPDLLEITTAPTGQAMPYVFRVVTGSRDAAVGLVSLILVIGLFCSISITNAASRTTWALARDNALPLSTLFAHVDTRLQIPLWSMGLVTVIQMLLGLINLGSSSAFTAFVSVGVIALAITYSIPIGISLLHDRRAQVSKAPWNCGNVVGTAVNVIALAWIAFELVLFSMPGVLPVTSVSMNYASVVFVGLTGLAAVWYVHARKVYKGPPALEEGAQSM